MRTSLAWLVLSVGICPALADEMTLSLSGDFYQGGPAYEIIADGQTVASGVVSDPAGQTVVVEVGKPSAVAIRFTNDLAGPADAQGRRVPGTDRNLIIRSVSFGGETILGRDLPRTPGTVPRGEGFVVATNQSVQLPVPAGNPVPSSAAAESPVATRSAAIGSTAEPAGCASEIQLAGYSNEATSLNSGQRSQLADLARSTGCAITITGYSSTVGLAPLNKRIAEQRAQAVLDYLHDQGASFTAEQVEGFGETSRFGENADDNRRVVIQLR